MANAKKTTKPVEAVVVEPVEPAPRAPRHHGENRRYRSSSIFWGFAFIFVGVLVLLDNLNVVDVHFGNLWQLWPVLIIGAGVSMLSLKGWISGVLSALLAVAFAGLALLVSIDNPYLERIGLSSSQNVTTTSAQATVAEKELDLTLRIGATDIAINSSSSQDGFWAELRSNRMTLEKTTQEVRDGVQYATLETTSKHEGWWIGMGMMDNGLKLDLTQKVPVSLHIDSGASSLSGDLSSIQLKALTVKAGASSVDLRFGAKAAKQDVTFDAGASSVKLSIPAGVGVRIEADNGLSHTEFGDIAKVSDGVYESAGFATAETQITIHAKLGVSSFEVKRY